MTGRSITHTTKPVRMKKPALVSQRFADRGSKKIHMFSFTTFGTNIPTPMSVYGIVKSTYKDLFDVIVVSPATASNFWFIHTPMYDK